MKSFTGTHPLEDEYNRVIEERDALAAENAELRRQLEEAVKYEVLHKLRSGDWHEVTYAPHLTPQACLDCGRPAEVEVAGEGHLRPLCWECSGCANTHYLPDHHRCFLCGKAAYGQETGSDGLTRAKCPACFGESFTEEEE